MFKKRSLWIILVNYNSSQETIHIITKLKSLHNSNYFVIDNRSTTNQVEYLKRNVQHNSLILNKENIGFSRAVNAGIQKALSLGATDILLINPDIMITTNEVNKLLKSNNGISSPILKFKRYNRWCYDLGGRVNFHLGRAFHIESEQIPLSIYNLNFVSGACMLVKTSVFKKIGLFNEDYFMYFEDVDFCLRARQAGFPVSVNNNVVVEHNIIEHKLSKNYSKIRYQILSNLKFILKWVPFYYLPISIAYFILIVTKTIINLKFK